MAECIGSRGRRTVAALLAIGAGLAIPAHSGEASQAANDLICDIHQPPRNGVLAACSGPFPPGDEGITIELAGAAPNRVSSIRLSINDAERPFQVIDAAVRPVIDIETVGILFMDMNFDGYPDLGVMKNLRTGYRYYLYDPTIMRFAQSPELDAVAWPEFDQETRTIRSYRERADGTSVHETYRWNGGKLQRTED